GNVLFLYVFDNYCLLIIKYPKFSAFEYYIRSIKKGSISKFLTHGWASFCMKYCINAAWDGGDQPVVLLRCNGSPACFDSCFQVLYIVGSGVTYLLDNHPQIFMGSGPASLLAKQAQ
ncbi:hypothetical protein AMECASPLE_037967, partial [Ameca splendens]